MGYSLRLTWDVQTFSTVGIILFSEAAFGEKAANLDKDLRIYPSAGLCYS